MAGGFSLLSYLTHVIELMVVVQSIQFVFRKRKTGETTLRSTSRVIRARLRRVGASCASVHGTDESLF